MKYRKKPVIIEAVQFKGSWSSYHDICNFVGHSIQNNHCGESEPQEIYIETLEGTMTAKKYDWIIKGINGEFYPCKPDIFEKTYDLIDETIL